MASLLTRLEGLYRGPFWRKLEVEASGFHVLA